MTDPRFIGELALLEPLPGGDALATLHLARRRTGPVVIAQTFPAAATLASGWAAAAKVCDALAESKAAALLPVIASQSAPQPAIAYQLFQGVPLSHVLIKSQQDGMPLAADLALMVVEKVAEGLGKLPAGVRHPLLTGASVLVGYEGEVSVIDAPLAAALAGRPLAAAELGEWRAARLHKTVLGGKPSARAELWQLGALLLEMISGEPFATGGDIASTIRRLCDAQEVPADVREIVERCLVENAEAFRTLDDFKAAVGRLIYQGPYNPSSFNLAYFMHTLLRGEEDALAAKIKSLAALPLEFPAAPAMPAPPPAPAKPKAPAAVPTFGSVTGGDSGGPAMDYAPPPSSGGGKGMMIGIGVGLLVVVVGGWLAWTKISAKTEELKKQEAANAAQQAQIQKDREALDAAKRESEELKRKEAEAAELASGAKTAEEKKKAEEETARLAAQRKAAEERQQTLQASVTRKEEEARAASPAAPTSQPVARPAVTPPAPAPVSANPGPAAPQPIPAAPPAEAPADPAPQPAEPVKEIYSAAEVDIPATIKTDAKAEYPARGRGNATVIVRCTVDTGGNVADTATLKSDNSGLGFNEAAIAAARKLKFVPAIKDGRPVKSFYNKTYKFGG